MPAVTHGEIWMTDFGMAAKVRPALIQLGKRFGVSFWRVWGILSHAVAPDPVLFRVMFGGRRGPRRACCGGVRRGFWAQRKVRGGCGAVGEKLAARPDPHGRRQQLSERR